MEVEFINDPIIAEIQQNNMNIDMNNIQKVPTGNNYNELVNKPQINSVELVGNKSFEDLEIQSLTNLEIENLINSVV